MTESTGGPGQSAYSTQKSVSDPTAARYQAGGYARPPNYARRGCASRTELQMAMMRAIMVKQLGPADVMQVGEAGLPEPGHGSASVVAAIRVGGHFDRDSGCYLDV